MAEQFLTVEQAANLLHVHPITVRRQLRSGALRGMKTGKLWRIAESALAIPLGTDDPSAVAEIIWRDITSGDDQKRSAALKALTAASPAVNEIVMACSGEAAALFYDSPEGQEEWEDQADWRALDGTPVLDDEDESA